MYMYIMCVYTSVIHRVSDRILAVVINQQWSLFKAYQHVHYIITGLNSTVMTFFIYYTLGFTLTEQCMAMH